MKIKRQFIISLLFIFAGMSSGQGYRMLEIRGGYLGPKDTKSGLILGGSYGVSIDERVDLSIGIDYFHKTYEQESLVADTNYVSGVHEQTVMKQLEYSTTLLPVSAGVNIRIPFEPPLYWFVGGSVTYQFLFNNEKNFEEGISEKRNYRGWGWMLRGGIEYIIGSRSSLLMEAFYNFGKVC